MPPRLPSLRTAALPAPSALVRPFSSTAPVAAPREEPSHLHPQHHQRSSNSKLLAMANDRRAPRPSQQPRHDSAMALADRMRARSSRRNAYLEGVNQELMDSARQQKVSAEYLRQMPRVFAPGDVYSPHDLSPVEMRKWRRRTLRTADVVDVLGLRPLDMYKNFSLVQEFTNSAGMIESSKLTQLRPVNQRKIAKMIRRVQGMGLYPTIHDHPEMIRNNFYPPESRF